LRLRIVSLLAVIGVLAVSSAAFAFTRTTSVVAPTKITVTMHDYSFSWSKASVLKGPTTKTVIFTVKNAGAVAHNIDFTTLNKRSALLQPGGHTTLKIIFKKKGTIQVVCDVPRHIQLGMVSVFKVK
jgi:uncharacterized cupredoxin-like copper-binding protein